MSAIGAQLHSSDQEQVEARRKHLVAALDAAIAPGRAVLALAEVGITAEDLAVALAANQRTTSSWLAESLPAIKKNKHKQRIRELKEVVRFIVDNGTIAFQEADWLRDPNRSADFNTPLQLIRRGSWKEAGRLFCDDVAAEVPAVFQTPRGSRNLRQTVP